MAAALVRPFRFLARALVHQDSPRQLAAGFALGAVVGLVPKGNLIAVVLMMVLCAARVNLAAGLLAAFLFSWIGMLLDPLSHQAGLLLLEWETLRPAWTWLYNLPIVPWTRFNNTVVLGSLLIGAALAYPLFLATRPLFARYTPRLAAKLRRYKIVQLLLGAELGGKLSAA